MTQLIAAILLILISIIAVVFAFFFFKARGITVAIAFAICALYGSYISMGKGLTKLKEGKIDQGECRQHETVKVVRSYKQHKYYDYEERCIKYGPVRIWAKGKWNVLVEQPKGRELE